MREFRFRSFPEYLLILFMILLIPANSLAQEGDEQILLQKKVSFSFNEAPLKEIFSRLGGNYQLSFLYVEEQVDPFTKISASENEIPLGEALDLLLRGTPLTYFLLDDQIVIGKKQFVEELEVDSAKQAAANLTPDSSNIDEYSEVRLKSFSSRKGRSDLSRSYKIYLKKRRAPGPGVPKRNDILPENDSVLVKEIRSVPGDSLSPEKDTVIWRKVKRSRDYRPDRRKNTGNFVRSFSAGISAGNTRWKHGINHHSNVHDLEKSNSYSRRNGYLALWCRMRFMPGKRVIYGTGLGIKRLIKKGTYTGFYNNVFYPSDTIELSENYRFGFSYLSVPLEIGVKTGGTKAYAVFMAGIETNIFLSSNMEFHYIYEIQYFGNLDPKSTGNPYSSYYYDENEDRIYPEKAEFKPLNLSFFIRPEIFLASGPRSGLTIAPEFTFFTSSVYTWNSPLGEIPFNATVFLSYSYLF